MKKGSLATLKSQVLSFCLPVTLFDRMLNEFFFKENYLWSAKGPGQMALMVQKLMVPPADFFQDQI